MGGETATAGDHALTWEGPSPRGRGNPAPARKLTRSSRSIPAWAGKPRSRWSSKSSHDGPSPRGRGNRSSGPVSAPRSLRHRSIPAWAGKPATGTHVRGPVKVHPRVGGETHSGQRLAGHQGGSIPAWAGKPCGPAAAAAPAGVHPRVGGETTYKEPPDGWVCGPSPRGRGNRFAGRRRKQQVGSIPAWAGKPSNSTPDRNSEWVHPRVGGETSNALDPSGVVCGPSPRGRGNPVQSGDVLNGAGSIPAWAGKPATRSSRKSRLRVHPRVGGETFVQILDFEGDDGPSPRGRGNRAPGRGGATPRRSIPAWAGKPPSAARRQIVQRVHPRVGGETQPRIRFQRRLQQGPSPRGRGNQQPSLAGSMPRMRSIPAWAGKPCSSRSHPASISSSVHPRVGGETRRLRWSCSR